MTPTTEAPQPEGDHVQLSRAQKSLVGLAATGGAVIAAIGFAGSYKAVRALAVRKGFGDFAPFFPIGIDAGIVVLLALDMLLAWIRMPFPLLRQTAWLLTAATIAFNGAAAWPDPLGVGMHAAIPVLFVVAVEAARHALGRIAKISANKHIESPPLRRWLIALPSTFSIWRRMGLHGLRSYQKVIDQERELKVYKTGLKKRCGGGKDWRSKATADELLPLDLAEYGVSVQDALAIPARRNEEQRQRKNAAELADQQHTNAMAAEQARHDDAEAERRDREEERQRERALADAQHAEQLAAVARRRQQADSEIQAAAWRLEQQRKESEAATAERVANAAKERANAIAKERQDADQLRILEAQRRAQAAATVPPPAPQAPARGVSRGATNGATAPATRPATATPQSAPAPRHESATRGATAPATKTPRKRAGKRHEPPSRGAIQDAIEALYGSLGRRPLEGEIVAELQRIKSPHDSRAFAQKVRSEVEKDKPHLAELGSDNVRALNQTKTG